jgi:hypothetical protein
VIPLKAVGQPGKEAGRLGRTIQRGSEVVGDLDRSGFSSKGERDVDEITTVQTRRFANRSADTHQVLAGHHSDRVAVFVTVHVHHHSRPLSAAKRLDQLGRHFYSGVVAERRQSGTKGHRRRGHGSLILLASPAIVPHAPLRPDQPVHRPSDPPIARRFGVRGERGPIEAMTRLVTATRTPTWGPAPPGTAWPPS